MRRAFGALLLLGAGAGAHAGLPAAFVEAPPAERAADAMDAPYGKLVVAEAARIIGLSADPQCLKTRNLTPEALQAGTREMFIRNGTAMLQLMQNMIDGGKFESAFEKQAGRGATAEYVRLRADPQVLKLIELGKPATLAQLVDHIVENVDRHARLKRVPLKERLDTLTNAALMEASPIEKGGVAMNRYADENRTPAIRRWLDMEAALGAAWKESLDLDAFAGAGPMQLTPTVVSDLAGLCVAQH